MRGLTCQGERHQNRGVDMNSTQTRQAIRNLDAQYRAAGLLGVDGHGETWYIRADGKALTKVTRPLQWAVDATEQGMDILSN